MASLEIDSLLDNNPATSRTEKASKRGRKPGSKNKPKEKTVVADEGATGLDDFWSSLEQGVPNADTWKRLNVDVPEELNEDLKKCAKEVGLNKSQLVNRILQNAVDAQKLRKKQQDQQAIKNT